MTPLNDRGSESDGDVVETAELSERERREFFEQSNSESQTMYRLNRYRIRFATALAKKSK